MVFGFFLDVLLSCLFLFESINIRRREEPSLFDLGDGKYFFYFLTSASKLVSNRVTFTLNSNKKNRWIFEWKKIDFLVSNLALLSFSCLSLLSLFFFFIALWPLVIVSSSCHRRERVSKRGKSTKRGIALTFIHGPLLCPAEAPSATAIQVSGSPTTRWDEDTPACVPHVMHLHVYIHMCTNMCI